MFAMNATLKPRAMAAYTGSSSNTSRERVLRVSSIGRLSDDPSSRPCDGRCKTSIEFCAQCRLLADALIGVQRLDLSGHATLFRTKGCSSMCVAVNQQPLTLGSWRLTRHVQARRVNLVERGRPGTPTSSRRPPTPILAALVWAAVNDLTAPLAPRSAGTRRGFASRASQN